MGLGVVNRQRSGGVGLGAGGSGRGSGKKARERREGTAGRLTYTEVSKHSVKKN